MGEFVGYRSNAKSGRKNRVNEGFVTVYAERRNELSSLGEYGGDAYPIVRATQEGEHEFGIILVADGVGQGAYTHPSLQKKLDVCCSNAAEDDVKFAKLSYFLRTLYGSEIFDKENADVLEYAMRCFADVPTDGFFVSPDEEGWKNKENNAQFVMPFFERDSQSLGSRILCVYIYLNYRNYMRDNNINEWDEEQAKKLRDALNEDIGNNLTRRVGSLFSHDDIDNTTKKMRYFLCATVAVWFYSCDKDGHISALSLNCGDARTYIVNAVDGVRQISVDDAVPDGSMTGFFHFGCAPKKDEGFNDNTFNARIIEAQSPCMLFACSDGVYDTCPANFVRDGYSEGDGKKYSLPYGETEDANDFMFAKNMLEALRRSFSVEDFRREIVFNFYAQNSTQGALECHSGGSYKLVKRDDSATLAGRFFGEKSPLEILEVLRKTDDTVIDRLWTKLEESANGNLTVNGKSYKIPYYLPHSQSADDAMQEEKVLYSQGEFKQVLSGLLRDKYPELFESMQKSVENGGAQTIWGAPHPSEMLSGYFLNKKFISPLSNYVYFLETALSDWEYLLQEADGKSVTEFKLPQSWNPHEHVICSEEIFDALKDLDFDKKYRHFNCSEIQDKTGDVMLALYGWFDERFTGCVSKGRNEVWTVKDDGRKSVNAAPAPDDVIKDIIGVLAPVESHSEEIVTQTVAPAEAPCEEAITEESAPVDANAEDNGNADT